RMGIIKAALSLAGLIVGVVLASNFYQELGGVLDFIADEKIANIVAFILILAVVMVIANVAAALLKHTAKAILLGWVDRLGGAVFGLFIGAIFMGAILAIIVKFFGTGLVTESLLAGILLDKFPLILALLPSEFDSVRDFFQ
ncbi:unnamed protein product, partial [marine sediment metagenome]